MTAQIILDIILTLLLWGAFTRLAEQHEEIFKLKHPEMFKEDDLMAEYLGKAEE